ncbi:MAG: DUF503 domain-containing protein [Planctomycetota bacterium]
MPRVPVTRARAMFIGVLQFTMAIPHAESLKDKRSVVRALKDRMRREFNVSIAEVEDLDDCNTATFGASIVGNDVAYLNGALDKLIDWLDEFRDARLEEHELEILRPR